MKAIKHFFWSLLFLLIVLIGGAIAYAYSGLYDMSVGSGHTAPVQWYLNTLRHSSIERAAAEIRVPPLDDAAMVEAGAVAYDQSCGGCHGKPGREPSSSWEPRPPALTRHSHEPAYNFWVVRNGIKMSAMPRIGAERVSDETLWQIIAFLEESPSLTEGEYRQMVEPPEPEPEPEPTPEETDEPAEGESGNGEADGGEAATEGESEGEAPSEEGEGDNG